MTVLCRVLRPYRRVSRNQSPFRGPRFVSPLPVLVAKHPRASAITSIRKALQVLRPLPGPPCPLTARQHSRRHAPVRPLHHPALRPAEPPYAIRLAPMPFLEKGWKVAPPLQRGRLFAD